MQEVASITTGSSPSSLQRQSFSIVAFAIASAPLLNAFEVQGSEQQVPATSLGIHTGLPARAETVASASGTEWASAPPSA